MTAGFMKRKRTRYRAAEEYDIGEFLVKLLCETMNNESKRLLSLEEAV